MLFHQIGFAEVTDDLLLFKMYFFFKKICNFTFSLNFYIFGNQRNQADNNKNVYSTNSQNFNSLMKKERKLH